MTDADFKRAIEEALIPEYEAMIPEHGEHNFSEKFEWKMQKLIRRRRKPYYAMINTGFKRVACIIVMFLIVSFTTVMSVEALRKPFLDFLSNIFSDHTTIESVLDLNGDYPKTIEERYEITGGLEGFSLTDELMRSNAISYIYSNGNNSIMFSQRSIIGYKNQINTEYTPFSVIQINGNQAISYLDEKGYCFIIWNNGKYIFDLFSDLEQDALIKMAEFVKKRE